MAADSGIHDSQGQAWAMSTHCAVKIPLGKHKYYLVVSSCPLNALHLTSAVISHIVVSQSSAQSPSAKSPIVFLIHGRGITWQPYSRFCSPHVIMLHSWHKALRYSGIGYVGLVAEYSSFCSYQWGINLCHCAWNMAALAV